MTKNELIVREFDGQLNWGGDPVEGGRSDEKIWELLMDHFQKHPTRKYLKHFHEYRFTPEVPERFEGDGIGRLPMGHFKEVLTVYWQ